MSFNEENFEQYKNQPGTVTEIKDDFMYVILTSLNKIVRRVNDLDKFTEDLFGKLDKEINSISFKLKILHEDVIQLAEAIITHTIPNEVLSMQVWKSRKNFPNVTIETQQVYSCSSLPIDIFERNNADTIIPLLTVPSYYPSDMEDSSSSVSSFPSCLYCSKLVKENVSVNKEQTIHKYLQDKNLSYDSELKNMLQCQGMTEHISVDHIAAFGSKVSHSYLDQPEGGSSFYIFPPNKCKLQGKFKANFLPGEQEHLHYNIECMSNSQPRVLYGTGKGDGVLSQPPPYKTNVFTNPLAPEAPPLLSDCLLQLTSSNLPSAPRIINSISSPVTSSLLFCETTTSDSLKNTSNIDLKMTPELSSTSELLSDDLSLQSQDQMVRPRLYPSLISLSSHSWDSVVDLIDSAVAVQPQQYSTCQSIKSIPQSLKSAKSPVSPKSQSAHDGPSLKNKGPNTPLSAQLPRSSGVPHRSVSVSASSNPKTKISVNLSPAPKRSVSHLTKLIEAQSRSTMTNQRERQLHPPQSKLSCFASTKVTTLQSSLASMKSTSISSHRALAISQYALVPDVKQNSFLPIMSKARKALMEAIRNGIRLRKTQGISRRNEAGFSAIEADIRFRRKAMGYNSGKSDSETEWAE